MRSETGMLGGFPQLAGSGSALAGSTRTLVSTALSQGPWPVALAAPGIFAPKVAIFAWWATRPCVTAPKKEDPPGRWRGWA